ncbi:MAG TPA: hypothetical protein VGO93_30300 [Candidatus Xenobia bacterium]|jgi:hypothetical protein
MRYLLNPLDMPVRAGTTWICCGGIAQDEDPSFLTLWEGEDWRGRILDPGCDTVRAQIELIGQDNEEPYLPARIETTDALVAQRLSKVFFYMNTQVVVQPRCLSPDLMKEHACVMMSAVVGQTFATDVPPATADRAMSALLGLMEKPDWQAIPERTRVTVEKLMDRPVTISFRAGDVTIQPVGAQKKSETIRIQRRRYPILGTEWDWLRSSTGKGPLVRRQIDVLCGVAEILLKLVRDGIPQEPQDIILGNWLKMPRSVRLSQAAA